MILVTKSQRDALDRVGLLNYKKTRNGIVTQDQNFLVTNRKKKSSKKSYYVVESPEVLLFLEKYDTLNLWRIRPKQLQELIDKGLLKPEEIQYSGTYVPGAKAFVDSTGQARIRRITNWLVSLGIWKERN